MYRNALTCWQSDQRGMFRHKKRSTNGDDKSRPSRAGTSGDVDSRTGVLPDGSCLAGAKAAAFAPAKQEPSGSTPVRLSTSPLVPALEGLDLSSPLVDLFL